MALIRIGKWTIRWVFRDRVRPLELFSSASLLAWALLLATSPETIVREAYQSFASFGVMSWAIVMALLSVLQFSLTILRFRWRRDLRIIANCAAGGVWFVVFLSFVTSGVTATADMNYLLLSSFSLLAGVYLGWKSQSC